MPANVAKVFLKVISVYHQEPSAVTSDFGHQDENYKNIFLLAANLLAEMMSTSDDHNIMQW